MTAPLSDPLRAAARRYIAAGNSAYRLAADAGVKPNVVSRWLAGKDLYLSTADKLAAALGVALAPAAKGPINGRGPGIPRPA